LSTQNTGDECYLYSCSLILHCFFNYESREIKSTLILSFLQYLQDCDCFYGILFSKAFKKYDIHAGNFESQKQTEKKAKVNADEAQGTMILMTLMLA